MEDEALLAQIKSLLSYDPDTGIFRWLVERTAYGGGVNPGDEAGTPQDGYIVIGVLGKSYRAHRLAWWQHKWCAFITVNGKRKSLGYSKTLEGAAELRRAAEQKYHGEFKVKEAA